MSFLLDTNIVSEWMRPAPNPGLLEWAQRTDGSLLYLSAISLGEIRFGVELLAPGARRRRLAG